MGKSVVAVVKTAPERVLDDYRRVMELAGYRETISKEVPTLLKLNLSWSLYFPACSTAPWQLEGVLKTLVEDGYDRARLFPVENKTVCTVPSVGIRENRWGPLFDRYGVEFVHLAEAEWRRYEPKGQLLKLAEIYPDGLFIPAMFPGKQVVHLPTVKTHGHSVTTGAIKNAFGGLLSEVRHYCHKYIHEVLVDLMILQREIHPAIFAVMDGTVCGNGAGPRCMVPVVKDVLLASADSVAIDAIAAKMMGFNPLEIPYLRMCHERGLGVADPAKIEVVGADISAERWGFKARRSVVIATDQFIRRGPLAFAEWLLLRSPLMVWAPFASNTYHDFIWYPLVGRGRIRNFSRTKWGRLFERYADKGARRRGAVTSSAAESGPKR